MSEEFDPDAYLKADADFDPDAFLGGAKKPDVGAGETFLNKATDAVPLGRTVSNGLGTALLMALRPKPGATLPPAARAQLEAMGGQVAEPKGVVDTYRDMRDTRAARTEAGAEQHPMASKLGTATGIGLSILAPMPKFSAGQGAPLLARLAAAGKTGAAYGALNGLTNGNADLTRGEVGKAALDTAGNAALGGVFGLAAGAVGEGLGAAAPALRRLAINQGRQAIQGSSDVMAATRAPLSDEAVREVLDQGLITQGSTTPTIYGRIDAASEREGALLGTIIRELEARGITGPNAREVANRLLARHREELLASGSDESSANVFRDEAENLVAKARGLAPGEEGPLTPAASEGRLGLTQAEGIKRALQKAGRFERLKSSGKEESLQEASSMLRQATEDAIDQQAQGRGEEVRLLADSFVPQKTRVGRLLEARDFAERGAAKAAQRSPVSLKDMLMGGAVGADPVTKTLAMMGSSMARNRLPSFLAATSNDLASGLEGGGAHASMGVAAPYLYDLAPDRKSGEKQSRLEALLEALRRQKGTTP